LLNVVHSRYGIGTHFSAAVIYGIMFYTLSKYYEKINIKGSLNLTMSMLLTAFSVGVFEFTWMASYYTAQHQTWVLAPLFKQVSILYQNLLFVSCGSVMIAVVALSRFQTRYPQISFRINKKLAFLILLTISLWSLWYFYPFPTTQLVVSLETGGVWKSFSNFPQTMYTIDVNPLDDVAIGVPFYVEDHLVHTINTVFKIVFAYTIFYFGKVIIKSTKNH